DDASLHTFFEGFHTQPTMPIIQTLPRAQAIQATLRSLSLLPTVEALPPPAQVMRRDSDPGFQSNPYHTYNSPASGFKVVTAPPQHAPHAPHAMVGPHADDDVENLITQGSALRTQGRHEEALATFQQAMQRNPQSTQAWFHLGFMYAELARF